MQEVTIRLRFIRECLGFAQKPLGNGRDVIYRMPRDGQGRVMFLTSWWHNNMRYAAKVVGRCYNDVSHIAWAPSVDGMLAQWRRIVAPAKGGKRARYALHEAFRPNAEIGVTAVLPEQISVDDFTELLSVVGTYKGISPFQSVGENYGTFEVISVMPTIRQRGHNRPRSIIK